MNGFLYTLAAYLLLLEGVAYTITAAVVFDARLTLDSLRFAGTGLGWVFLALLNLSAQEGRTRRSARFAVGANALGLLYFVLLAVASPGWLSAIAILLVLGCLVGSLTGLRHAQRLS